MRALTLTQPWASLVAIGAKRIETRSWATQYRGPLAIHAAKDFPEEAILTCLREPFGTVLRPHFGSPGALPRGAVVAIAELVACELTDELLLPTRIDRFNAFAAEHELKFGNYAWGRYAWIFSDVQQFPEPYPIRGYQGLWEWEVPHDLVMLTTDPTGRGRW